MKMWIYTIEPSLEIIQFEASETRGEYKVAYSEIIYVGFKLPKWPHWPVWSLANIKCVAAKAIELGADINENGQ